MKILITGAKGFIGRNLVYALKNIMNGYHEAGRGLAIEEVWEYDVDSNHEALEEMCRNADFIFHLAGVNRPKEQSEHMKVNYEFTKNLLDILEKQGNSCPIMFASSIQASLIGKYADSEYGRSKRNAEELFFCHASISGARVLVYRFPNLFGKWCRANYNSVVATFCYNLANDLPITINDRSTEIELVYIDDLVSELLNALELCEHRCEYFDGITPVPHEKGRYCFVPISYRTTLGRVADIIQSFKENQKKLMLPDIPNGSLEKRLYSTYLSYLPREKIVYPLNMNTDVRGSFTEIFKTQNCGQVSVNVTKPGITKGQHWHSSKCEFFVVVSGHAMIEERMMGTDEILRFEVSGEKLQIVQILPGCTHSIKNISKTEALVTLMWANESFDIENPDTFYDEV